MTRNQQIQNLYRLYKEQTGTEDVDLKKFAKWMQKKGWKMPIPADPIDLLAKRLAEALREETRKDETTGLPYKVNLNYSTDGTGHGVFWIDVDEAARHKVVKALTQRRDQMVGDAYQLTLIQDHWNNTHPGEQPIQTELDFQPDVNWKKAGGDEQAPAA
ncbi:MAG: hypothetical protein QOH39_2481 [Verrucomicrobiota bacterium]|jgi:hypothetical protein